MGGEVVHDVVKQFVQYLYRHTRERNIYEIHSMYESSFAKLSERFFKQSPWPAWDDVAPLVDNDQVFRLLYREMTFRHLYTKLQPTLEQRCESWDNYCELFQVVLNTNVNAVLPNQWLWDMIDEFVAQFQSFCLYRADVKARTEAEVTLLRECDQVWNALGVLNYLQALVDKSDILGVLARDRAGEGNFTETDGYSGGGSNVLRTLGYFALAGLQSVHAILGDFYCALKAAEPLDIAHRGLFQRVTGCHIAVYYHTGLSHLMMRRYAQAASAFNHILLYISRTKQYHSHSAQYEEIVKRNEQMYALLALAVGLCPGLTSIEESVSKALHDKHGDKIQRMARGEESVYEELFSYACPRFVAPAPPDYDGEAGADRSRAAHRLQMRLFLAGVRQQAQLPALRSYLRLYTSIPLAKLASFMEVSEARLAQLLMALKHKGAGAGESSGGLTFYVDGGMVHARDHKPERKVAEFYAQHTLRLAELVREVGAGAGTAAA